MKDQKKVKWLVENFEADNKIWKLIEELKSRNQPIEVIDYYKYSVNGNICDDSGMPTKSSFKDDDCVVVQGSIQLAMWVKQNKPWVPAVWLDVEKFKCTTFYSHLGKFLLNQDYEFTTISEYKRRFEYFFEKYGIQDCVFIRPNSGLKSFSGQIFKKENHGTDWNYFDMCASGSDIIVVSSPKVINSEFRFVVGDGKIIASSMYQYKGDRKQLPGSPSKANRLVELIIEAAEKELKPGPMYCIDVCDDMDGKFHLMELNCFTCSGMYECDKKLIIDAANEIALREWNEYHRKIV